MKVEVVSEETVICVSDEENDAEYQAISRFDYVYGIGDWQVFDSEGKEVEDKELRNKIIEAAKVEV